MAQIIHTSTGASNTGAAVDVNALTLPGISSLDSLFEIDSGVVLDEDGLGVSWYNKAPSWGSGWAEYIRGNRTLLDTEAPLAGYPTLDFPQYPYQTYSQMLVPSSSYFLLSNAGYSPSPSKRKHTLCAVFKPGNSGGSNNYILSGVSGYGYSPGHFSLMGIQYDNGNNRITIITRDKWINSSYLFFPYPSWYNETDWTIFIWNYDMTSGDSIVYLNGIKIFDGYFKTALSLGGSAYPSEAGIGLDGNYGGSNFVGKYAAVACWNYNLEADEDFFLNTTNYFATKYGITI